MPTLVEEPAAQHLGGALPVDFIEIMAPDEVTGEMTGEMTAWAPGTFG